MIYRQVYFHWVRVGLNILLNYSHCSEHYCLDCGHGHAGYCGDLCHLFLRVILLQVEKKAIVNIIHSHSFPKTQRIENIIIIDKLWHITTKELESWVELFFFFYGKSNVYRAYNIILHKWYSLSCNFMLSLNKLIYFFYLVQL
jgi:hypothetical protein